MSKKEKRKTSSRARFLQKKGKKAKNVYSQRRGSPCRTPREGRSWSARPSCATRRRRSPRPEVKEGVEREREFVGGGSRSKKQQGESFLLSSRALLFCRLSVLFFHEFNSSRSRPFRPRSARPQWSTRSKRPRGGDGMQIQAFNDAPLRLDSANKPTKKRKRCRG